MTKLAIVIINWKHADETIACLQSLERSSVQPAEIIVIENGSNDGSAERILAAYPAITVLVQPRNLGFAGGANAGIHYAMERGAEAVLLLNNDALMLPDTLALLVRTFESKPHVGALSAKVMQAENPKLFWTVGGVYRRRRVISFGADEPDRAQYDYAQLDFAYGCALLLRVAALTQAGIFDSRYFIYYEDVDLCLRLKAAGWKVALDPAARVLHHGSRSTEKIPARRVFYMARSRQLFFARHLLPAERIPFALAELRYSIVQCARWIMRGQWRLALAHLHGCIAAFLPNPTTEL